MRRTVDASEGGCFPRGYHFVNRFWRKEAKYADVVSVEEAVVYIESVTQKSGASL